MIDLHFGKYGIKTADRLNIVLYEKVENTKTDSKNFGKTSEKVIGYYGSLENALNAYVKVAAADKDSYTATNIMECLYLLEIIKEMIKQECIKLSDRIKAVEEKQIPKKPTYVDTRVRHHGRHISDGSSLDKCYKCPNCGDHIFHIWDSEIYCPRCGQALDWSDYE